MKKKLLFLFGIMLILIIASNIIIKFTVSHTDHLDNPSQKLQIVTSFYPVYMIGTNLTYKIDSIEVNSLTDLNTGCLHDYQLTTQDMKLISNADIMIINGGGMEGFLEDITINYPDLTIIDASKGISMLPGSSEEEHDHNKGSLDTESEPVVSDIKVTLQEEEPNTHVHGEWNAHVWLQPKLYIQQVENVKVGIENYIKNRSFASTDNIQAIEENAQNYIQKISALDSELNQLADNLYSDSEQVGQRRKAVIFHDSFAYLAESVGIEVTDTIPLDSDTALSAGDIAKIVRRVKEENIEYLFTEEQYSDSIAKQIEAETNAKVYIIDSAVTGDGSKDSYMKAMKKNIEVMKKALQQQ